MAKYVWTYLPVYTTSDNKLLKEMGEQKSYFLVEAHCTEKKKELILAAWTSIERGNEIYASGGNVEELIKNLELMIKDCRVWKPVAVEDLKVGMKLERNV